MTDEQSSAERSKVGRVIEEYDLEGVGQTLERRWTGATAQRWSLRDLADWFNQRVLEAALAANDRLPADEAIESTYRFLTDEAVSPTAHTQTRRDLEQRGIEVDELESAFVSHQAVHTYLTSYRGASLDDTVQTETPGEVEATIDRLQSKTAAVTASKVERQVRAGNIDVGDPEAIVTIDVVCTECGDSFGVGELLDVGGCRCSAP